MRDRKAEESIRVRAIAARSFIANDRLTSQLLLAIAPLEPAHRGSICLQPR
jgi:hypothetical protein